MNTPPSVRTRAGADLSACTTVLAAVHRRDGYPVNWPADPASWLCPEGQVAAWVAVAGSAVVGHVTLARPVPGDVAPGLAGPKAAVAVVGRLFVAPTARGRGTGAALLERATRAARRRGLRAVLDVVARDTAAVAVYERLGWEPLGSGSQAWGPNQWVEVRCFAAPV
ncbi:GNAT family N-acetyltransferase [Streptomyces beihaiensis]|uniref:GNAT family N-acetyltransferase n=1 Tax=Streptomyces beihaiensis TaxID=2984495 RepID=A0ABT3U0I9_9ACTN|nr:GNAT family N-acetyltransferase [Streptomyces beihaiensis]MCX3062831.1 GNAT family N-acetyltransferase [Streptomyces beihaiensis]